MGKVDDVKGRTAYSALLVEFLQEHCYVEKKKKRKKGREAFVKFFFLILAMKLVRCHQDCRIEIP